MKLRALLVGAVSLAALGCSSHTRDGAPATRLTKQVARITEGGDRYAVNYWQYLPPPSHGGKPPVLIFLHGYGERGVTDDPGELRRVLAHGPPKLVEEGNDLCFRIDGRRECFVLLAPQSLGGHDWWSSSVVPIVDAMIDRARVLRGDTSRIYLTGLSMGGAGTWSYAAAIDFERGGRIGGTRLAAIVPIAGEAPSFSGCRIAAARIAVWAFHGTADDVIDPIGSSGAVAEVNACTKPRPHERAHLTLYRGVGHDSWTRTYDPTSRFDLETGRPDRHGVSVYEWLLRHHR